MTRHASSSEKAGSPAYQVEAPRASDAIGLALRDAFERDYGLPVDMTMLLRRLNGADTLRSH
jgi:hypothetical protein